nr:MAG TPA: hypothetical protein [Bacteriophage sp.]
MEKSNFNPIGNRPLAPTIYDENITPLESMNKLAFKINKLIGDDTNVKEVVDKLLDVYASHMKLQGGYCEELKCIAFENPISCGLEHTSSPIYTPVKTVEVGVNNVKGNVTFYQWQYKNDNGLFVDLEAEGSNTAKCKVPVTFYNSGDKKEFRCKLQNDKYTYYTDAIVIKYVIPTGTIIQSKNGKVNTYEQNQLTFDTDFETDSDNIGWMWSNDNKIWNKYGQKGVSIKPYYYVDQGTKTNGVSVQNSNKIYWKYQFKVKGNTYYSNVLETDVTTVDYDCGSATFNGVANNNWNKTADMIQWYSYQKAYDSSRKYCDLNLSIDKELNNSVITTIQWLQKVTDILGFTNEPTPNTLLENATDINENITVEQEKNGYLWKSVYAFRLQVIVGNVAYYSKNVYVNTNLAKIDIAQSPNGTLNIESILTLTGTFNEYVPNNYDINNIQWFLSNNRNSWSNYTVYGSSNNVITVKIYNDNASHIDGFGVNGGTALYIWASVDNKICGVRTISIKQS